MATRVGARCAGVPYMPVLTLPAGQLLNGWLDEIDTEATWEELARKQSDGTFASLTTAENVEEGDCLAMLDRNTFAQDFKRRIFVVLDSDAAYIFDEVGGVIDEPDEGVPGGIQPLRVAEGTGFLDEWKEGYYMMGTIPIVPYPDEPEANEDETPAEALPESTSETTAETPNADEVKALTAQLLTVGCRIQECFKRSEDDATGYWYGGVVGDALEDRRVPVAFDDGDLCLHSPQEVYELAEMSKISLCTVNGGLVAGVPQPIRAVALSLMKCAKSYMPVGVLLSTVVASTLTLAGYPVYHSHVVSVDAAAAAFSSHNRRPTRATEKPGGSGGSAYDDRMGYHSFRRGYIVFYHEDSTIKETVFGVQVYYYARQQHRNLITFSSEFKQFSIQPWTSWHAIPLNQIDDNLDPDMVNCQFVDTKEVDEMMSVWPTSKLTKEANTHDKIKKLRALGPAKVRFVVATSS